MKENKISNYEKWCEEWCQKFLQMDLDDLKMRVPELVDHGNFLSIFHFGRQYRIDKQTGIITLFSSSDFVSSTVRLNIYTLFAYAKPYAHIQDEWVPFERLKNARPFGPAFQKGNVQSFAQTFAGHLDKLEAAFQKLGGKRIPFSDMGYQIDAFSCIPMRFLFWDKDDEFPAQANILFDKSATDFIHVESTVTIASVGISMLTEAASLTPSGTFFQVQ